MHHAAAVQIRMNRYFSLTYVFRSTGSVIFQRRCPDNYQYRTVFFVCQARISDRLFLRSQKIFFVKLFVHIIMGLQDGIIAEDGVGVFVSSVPLSSEASLPLIDMEI